MAAGSTRFTLNRVILIFAVSMNIELFISADDLKQKIYDMPLNSKLYVAEVPNSVYHGSPGWSSSHAKKAYQSEQRLHRYLEKQKEEEGKDHYVFGELTHDSIRLTANQIDSLYCDSITLPKGQTNLGKAMKAVIESGHTIKLESAGFNLTADKLAEGRNLLDVIAERQVIKPKEKREARELAEAVLNQYTVRNALQGNEVIFELSIWHKMHDGFIRKCRPDAFIPSLKTIFDWKTIRELIWTFATGDNRHMFIKREIKREIQKRDYGLSAAWYMDILELLDEGAFLFVFADKDSLEVYPPYVCGFDELYDDKNRCLDAIKAIKSYKSKLVEGNVIQELSTFVPNDDYLFTSQQQEYIA